MLSFVSELGFGFSLTGIIDLRTVALEGEESLL